MIRVSTPRIRKIATPCHTRWPNDSPPSSGPFGEIVQCIQDFRCAPGTVTRSVGELDNDPRLGEGTDIAAGVVSRDSQLLAQKHTVDDWLSRLGVQCSVS